MTRVDIYIKGKQLDLYDSINYSITRQVNDFTELRTRQWNYTDKWKIPKTAHNKKIFDFLGVPGNLSDLPYVQIEGAQMYFNGLPAIQDGFAFVGDTGGDYSLHINDGSIFFYGVIKDITLRQLDWSAINHNYNEPTMVDSWTNTSGYVYPAIRTAEINKEDFFFDAPSPFVFLKDIVNLIGTIAGVTIAGDILTDELYNRAIVSTEKSFRLEPTNQSNPLTSTRTDNYTSQTDIVETDPPTVTSGAGFSRVKIDWSYSSSTGTKPLVRLFADGVASMYHYLDENEGSFEIILYGDVFEAIVDANNFAGIQMSINLTLSVDNITFVDKYVDFSELMPDTALSNFMRQVLVKFGLNLYSDTNNKTVELNYINNFDTAENQNISRYYNSRTKESYRIGKYAAKNNFTYKIKEDQENTGIDGIVYRTKTDETRTHFSSAFTEPILFDEDFGLYNNLLFDEEGKPQDGDFIIGVLKTINNDIEQKAFGGGYGRPFSTYTAYDFEPFKFSTLLPKYYSFVTNRVFNKPNIQKFKFGMPVLRYLQLDLQKLIYLEQEASQYIISKAKYKSKGFCEMDLIKVERKLIVFPNPVAVITGETVYANTSSTVTLYANDSYSANGYIESLLWTVTDENGNVVKTETATKLTFLITDNETFNVCLEVTDNIAKTNEVCLDVESVIPIPAVHDYFGDTTVLESDFWCTEVQVEIIGSAGEFVNMVAQTSFTNGTVQTEIWSSPTPTGARFLLHAQSGAVNHSLIIQLEPSGLGYLTFRVCGTKDQFSNTANRIKTTLKTPINNRVITLISRQITQEAL